MYSKLAEIYSSCGKFVNMEMEALGAMAQWFSEYLAHSKGNRIDVWVNSTSRTKALEIDESTLSCQHLSYEYTEICVFVRAMNVFQHNLGIQTGLFIRFPCCPIRIYLISR